MDTFVAFTKPNQVHTEKTFHGSFTCRCGSLSATPQILANDIKTAGFLFETLCFRDLSVYMDALDGKVFHYHDKDELEADAILQLPDGRWGATEIKLGTFEFDHAADNLLRLRKKLDGEAVPPSFLAIISASGGMAWQGLYQEIVPKERNVYNPQRQL